MRRSDDESDSDPARDPDSDPPDGSDSDPPDGSDRDSTNGPDSSPTDDSGPDQNSDSDSTSETERTSATDSDQRSASAEESSAARERSSGPDADRDPGSDPDPDAEPASGLPAGDGRSWRDRLDRTTRRVLGVVAVAFAVRLALLGARVVHFDEGRVGWWALHFLDSGQFEYRYIIHGPLVQHVNKFLFDALGANDFTLRLFVAVVGALLPLAALLFREHLDGDEVVAAAFFLALNPILVYYSRFFRSTLLAAAFAFVAFGLLVRAYDERSARYVHGAVVFVALAFTAKENAAVYLLVWVGATALLVDHALFRTGSDRSGFDWLSGRADDLRRRPIGEYVPDLIWHLGVAVVLFVAVTLYFYAPRSPNAEAVGFWQAIGNPALFPDMFGRTLDDVVEGYSYWFGGTTDAGCRKDNVVDAYLCFLGEELHALARYSFATVALAVVGFLAERYGRARHRNLVLFTGYWGFVSIIGYPLGTDIANAWIAVNALVPLAIPAGVGLALVVRRTRDSLHTDSLRFGLSAFVLVLVAGYMVVALAGGVYADPTSESNELVQYAQPADDFRPAMRVLDDHAADHEGTDVLFVGSSYVRDQARTGGIEPRCTSIGDTLPLQWYVESYGATGDCAATADDAREMLSDGEVDPLVVIAPNSLRTDLEPALEGYAAPVYGLRTYGSEAVFFNRDPDGNATAG